MSNQGSGELDLNWKGLSDYLSTTYCLTNRNTEAQDGHESDLKSHNEQPHYTSANYPLLF